ncbi:capsular polysaccharide export protein, LipB/KpsS family [Metabacillus elymi]|uniref:Uncharacterized protein n=1 Tax=Metabacillus elymi TaxID=2745198 RepID=A0ABX6S3S4_9BACI|nr:hypothetical protein [Metabacillus sp. KUDC1714]QNF28477.1 hypothetical protein HUW50_13925 [Metabacillus sp. KUDC1714]
MEEYFINFYSFHLDFIHQFREIEYKGIPLPLLIKVENYFTRCNLHPELSKPSFKDQLKVKINQKGEIQKQYNLIMDPLVNRKTGNKQKNGKLMLYDFVLHAYSFAQYLDPSKIHMMNHVNAGETFKNYEVDMNQMKDKLVMKAKEIFGNFKSHPIYSNPGFQNMFLRSIPVLLNVLGKIDNYFEKVPISCVIVGTTTDTFSRILTIMAGKKGIPSLCLQHGLFGEIQFMPVFATKNCVFGNYEKEWYLARGVDEDRIEVTGHPRHDRIFMGPQMPKSTLQQKLGLNAQKKSVVVATQPHSDIDLLSNLIQILSKNSSFEILIKPHPHEYARNTLQKYESILSAHQSIKIVPREIDLYHLLYNIDLVIVAANSTMGLEAMMFKKPIVLFLKTKDHIRPDLYFYSHFDYFDDMGRFVSSDPKSINHLAGQLFSNKSPIATEYNNIRNKFVSNRYPNEYSFQTISDLIFKLTGNRYIKPTN